MMNNEMFLNQMKNTYESLKSFTIKNNYLFLNSDKTYMIPFSNVLLASLNPNLFLLDPNEIFHILYMLELLPKPELNDNEIAFITQYVNDYLKLNDLALEKEDINNNKVWCRSIPIYSSYDPAFINNPISKIIQDIINTHSNEMEKGKGTHMKLVLTNPNVESIPEEDYISDLGKAGFTTLVLIAASVVATTFYIINFIFGA